MKFFAKTTAALFGVIMFATAVSAQFVHFSFISDRGDFIGQGRTVDNYYTWDGLDPFPVQVGNSVSSRPADLHFSIGGAFLTFGTHALDIPLQTGTYLDAQRAAFAQPGHPGLDVAFENRGSNTVTGSFTVYDFQFIDSPTVPTITHFLATFEQHSEGGIPAMRGTFEYSLAPIAVGVPEPATYGLVGGVGLMLLVLLRGPKGHATNAAKRV